MNLVVHDETPLDPLEEALVSYLDGELQGAERAELERKLDQDEQLRARLQAMQRAWDMLDNLGVVEGDEKFARTTIEIVAIKAAADYSAPAMALRKPWIRYAALSSLLAICCLGAFFAVRYYATAEDRQLVRDLPVIEKLDEYQSMPSFEFLQRLEKEKLFSEDAGNGSR